MAVQSCNLDQSVPNGPNYMQRYVGSCTETAHWQELSTVAVYLAKLIIVFGEVDFVIFDVTFVTTKLVNNVQ